MLGYSIPYDLYKLRVDKEALEYLIKTDTNEKDKAIHEEALKKVIKKLKEYE